MNISKILNIILALALLAIIIKTSFNVGQKENNSSDMKTDAIENIMNRKSVRSYLDKNVEDDKINTMLKAAMAAPSGKDNRPWEFIVVKDKEKLARMAEKLPYAKMLKDVNQAVVICGDTTKSSYWYLDCSAATQNFLLAAEALGLGAVWTATFPYDDRISVVREVLEIPAHIVPLNVIPFGYPVAEQSPKEKFDLTRIHIDKF